MVSPASPVNQSFNISRNDRAKGISLAEASLPGTTDFTNTKVQNFLQNSPTKKVAPRPRREAMGSVDVSLSSVNQMLNSMNMTGSNFKTMKHTSNNSPSNRQSLMDPRHNNNIRVAIKTPNNLTRTSQNSPSLKANGQFLRTQNFSSLTKKDRNDAIDIQGFPAGVIRRAQSPLPVTALDHPVGGGVNPKVQDPIPYYLRGKSVNEKMLPGGRQPGMAMGFVADYQRNDQNEKAQQQTRDPTMNISGIPTVQEILEYSYKATFNLKNPKYGLKGYYVQDTGNEEPVYKVA